MHAGQVMNLGSVPGYSNGGTIHVIVNNQIGFTTDPKLMRSTPHPSDMAKGSGAPIFHVNADDPEAVVRACQLAVDYWIKFQKDVVIDVVGPLGLRRDQLRKCSIFICALPKSEMDI